MLNGFVIEPAEAESVVAIAIVVGRNAVDAAAPCIIGGGPPIETKGRLRMQIRGRCSYARQCVGGVLLQDGRITAAAGLQRPFRELDTSADDQQPARRPKRQVRRTVWLLETVVHT